MRLARNMAAAMANSVVVVLINLIALPFYLRFLGMEAYGLIGFYATLQTVLQVLDLGLAPTVSREIAHGAEVGQQRRSASLLRTLGVVYIGVAVLIAALVALVAPWIGSHWLQARALPAETVAQAVMLMGVNLACRWPISLYHGALVGAHRLARSAATSMTINICAAITTIAVLAWGVRSIEAFFIVQAAFGLLHAIVLRVLARRAVGERDAPYDFRDLRRVWHFSAWMSGVAITGLVLSQFDKIVLSRVISLEPFAHYMLAALLVSGLQILTTPTLNTLFPKFSALIARGDGASLKYLYESATKLFATALFALAFGLVFQTQPLVTLWLGDAKVASEVAPLAAWLAIGSALNGIMYFPYSLQLAAGKPKLAFVTALGLLIVMIPVVLALAARFGALGGALGWASINALYVVVGTWLTGRKVMAFAGWSWLLRNAGVPALATFIPALLGAWICRTLAVGPWVALGIGGIAALVGIAIGVAGSFEPREFRRVLAMAFGRPTPAQ
ncbi:oligosaccharide flippase family protein [Lysobacter sp. A6]|uniref:Oligosaccharide flippase family protein n=1 Tax=Noviluteimonas lactosilytica TaxID=2888523 RepID=A0ABS8JFX7_9GAMM|nr:oligosaccharide flippase family protein [Lysobacter lactosilyticus]MCC8362504.1 oligosaccharide flippase family protein [Lysobacter lactosilyticus]